MWREGEKTEERYLYTTNFSRKKHARSELQVSSHQANNSVDSQHIPPVCPRTLSQRLPGALPGKLTCRSERANTSLRILKCIVRRKNHACTGSTSYANSPLSFLPQQSTPRVMRGRPCAALTQETRSLYADTSCSNISTLSEQQIMSTHRMQAWHSESPGLSLPSPPVPSSSFLSMQGNASLSRMAYLLHDVNS